MSPEPRPDLLESLEREIRRRPVPTRNQHRMRSAGLVAASVVPIGAMALMRGFELGDRPLSYVVGLCLSWGLLAVVASVLVLRRPSTLGRPRAFLVAVASALPVGLAAASLAAADAFLEHVEPAPTPLAMNVVCTMMAIALSILPLAALLYVYRRSDPVKPAALGAALGAIAGSWSGAVLATLCPATDSAHVLFAHVGPIAVTAAASAAVGARLLRLRWIGPSVR
jgi:hypothetical protein